MKLENYCPETGEIFIVDLDRDWMVPVCYNLGVATANAESAPDTDHLERATWQYAYMKGYEKQLWKKRKEAQRRAQPMAKHGR